jgi:glutamine synthetase
MLMAGLDGIKNKIHPGEAMDKDLYDLPPEESLKDIPTVCRQPARSTGKPGRRSRLPDRWQRVRPDQIEAYIDLKMEENMRYEMTPHPVEFDMYYSS